MTSRHHLRIAPSPKAGTSRTTLGQCFIARRGKAALAVFHEVHKNTRMRANPIHRLRSLGQSVWLDFLDHALIASGELDRMIRNEGLVGLTSNPTIFEKSLSSSSDDDDLIARAPRVQSPADLFEDVEVHEVAIACDRLRPVY